MSRCKASFWMIAGLTALGLSGAARAGEAAAPHTWRIEEQPAARTAAPADAPIIEVQPARTEQAPEGGVPIQLIFRAAPGAHILPGTFKVLYGFWKVDITSEILRHAHPSGEGLTVDDGAIPPGEHRLLLQVRDDKDRRCEMRVSLIVE
jgi:hypothetical protein